MFFINIMLFSTSLAFSQTANDQDVFVPIAKYLQKGDADCLSAWFADNLEVDILSNSNNCSKNQAKQIIKSFFINYTPKKFVIVHKSGTYPMKYAIGNLDGGGNKFTVTIYVKTSEEGNTIQQIKIEKQ